MKNQTGYYPRNKFCFFVLLTCAFIFFNTPFINGITTFSATIKEVPINTRFESIKKMVWNNGFLYVLDAGNHRLVKISGFEVIEQIGMIGNNKGELFHPSDFFIAGDDDIYFLDKGNKRIQVISTKGRYKSHFPQNKTATGICVGSGGKIVVAQPANGKLLSLLKQSGNVISTYGDMVYPSAIFGEKYKKRDEGYLQAMNRVFVEAGGAGHVWVGFYHMPLICRYGPDGRPVLEKTIKIKGISALNEAVWDTSNHPEYLSFGAAGISLTLIIKGLEYVPKRGELFILLGDNRFLVIDKSGEEKYIIKPKIISGAIETFCLADNGDIFLSFFFSPKLYRLNVHGKGKK